MKKTYPIKNLCCANCARKIEDGIKKIPGVTDAKILFMVQKLNLETDTDQQSSVLAQVRKVAQKIEPDCEILG